MIVFLLAASAQAGAEAGATYVGRAQCAACHAEETARWTGSHHDLAMQAATEATVLGDFNDATFEQFGVASRFYREDNAFMVRTDGPDGALRDYPIQYTFGVYPLQQYLIALPGGRLQALDIAWDSRPKEDGGQRWMHLHPEDPVPHHDVLHWTGPNLNWNTMCADCHSTNLRKGYDADTDSYNTTWSEIDVSCEAGITCSDCHDPHSADLRLPGDQVCSQCHAPDRYATKAHHFHPEDSTGARCIDCHMPPKHYMVVDARHDHSFRVPRPDQSVALGTPNACNTCHTDESAQWAADQVLTWYGRAPKGLQDFAPALHAARNGQPGADALLLSIAADNDQPGIARATALQALGGYPSPAMREQVKQGLAAEDPLQRLGALAALDGFGLRERLLALPLLEDDFKAVRTEAARLLAAVPDDQLPPQAQARREQGIADYISTRRFNAERPESQLNLAALYVDQGRFQDAEQAYRAAIRLQPRFIPAYVNLAQLLSESGHEREADATLRAGLAQQPESADLHHALGLSLIRQKQPEPALTALARAAELAPHNARYGYVHAVALHAGGQTDAAIATLARVHQHYPGDIATLSALIAYHREAGQLRAALDYAQKLQPLQPGNRDVARLVMQLQAALQ
jgi:tetratricopeptide (TPR) repeat protein